MYWPVGVPSVYEQDLPLDNRPVSHDGLDAIHEEGPQESLKPPHTAHASSALDDDGISPTSTPPVPDAPEDQLTRARLAKHTRKHSRSPSLNTPALQIYDKGDIIDARPSRSGHLFATITRTSLAIWQTKACRVPGSSFSTRS